jgi:DNA-binding GntR family transcriptional regulator
MPPRVRKAAAESGGGQRSQQAATAIRDLIRTGELLPGEKIRQVEVAERAGVSRSPLREALRTLEAEGVVKYEANRGYVVNRLRMDELAEIYRLRVLIENEMLSQLSAPDAAVLRRLEGHVTEMEAAIKANDFDALTTAYREFRVELFSLSGLKIFIEEVQRLWNMTDSYNAAHTLPPQIASRILRDHRQIIKALRAGNFDRVEEIVASQPQINEYVIVGLPAWRPAPGRPAKSLKG